MSQRITKQRFLICLRKAFNDNNDFLLRNNFPKFDIEAKPASYYVGLFADHPVLLINMLIDLVINLMSNPLYSRQHKHFFDSLVQLFSLELQSQLAHNVAISLRNARKKGHTATQFVNDKTSLLLLKAAYMLEEHNKHCYEIAPRSIQTGSITNTAENITVHETPTAIPFTLQIPLLTEATHVLDSVRFDQDEVDMLLSGKEVDVWLNATAAEMQQHLLNDLDFQVELPPPEGEDSPQAATDVHEQAHLQNLDSDHTDQQSALQAFQSSQSP